MTDKKVFVEKSDGIVEPFDIEKLKRSLVSSEASVVLANEIAELVKKQITDKMTTDQIYKTAFDQLKKTERKTASRYSLRRSLLDLGPTGFPFEKFIAKILQEKGYKTKVGVALRGNCVEHEIDVVASNNDDLILCEIKFHNNLKIKTDTKVALYVKARYDDIRDKEFMLFGRKLKPTSGTIITNTKFTNNAKKYSQCAGLDLISWDYPRKGNLYDLIEETGIQPITSLISVTKSEKEKIVNNGIIDCADLKHNRKLLTTIGISKNKIDKIIEEAEAVCLR